MFMLDMCISELQNYNKYKMFKLIPTILEVSFSVGNISVVYIIIYIQQYTDLHKLTYLVSKLLR